MRILGADLQKCMTDSADRLLFSFPPPPAGAAFFKSSLVCTQMALSQNLASPSEGALVVLATASDERHPASNILDGCVLTLCRGILVSALRKSKNHLDSALSLHPPSFAMSFERSDEGTFWITTGMFPHEFIVSFPRPVQLFRIKILTKHGAFSLLAL